MNHIRRSLALIAFALAAMSTVAVTPACGGATNLAILDDVGSGGDSSLPDVFSITTTAEYEKEHDLLLIADGPHPGGPPEPSTISVYDSMGAGKTLVTNEGGAPSWTPDGRIIYSSTRGGTPQIWIMDADGGHAEQVGNLAADMMPLMPQMARNGLVAFMGVADRPDSNAGIWVMQRDGSG